MNNINAIEIKNLHKTYNSGFVALKGIDLSVKQGDFFALLGPNGAGKSTTIGILASLVNKTDGQVSIFGNNIDTDMAQAKTFLGLVPQEFNFNIFETPLDIVISQAGYYGVPRKIALSRAKHYLSKLGLWEKRNVISRMLSGGMKRRLMIARALIHEPKMLILDEPTAGVDIELRRSMWEFLQELNDSGITIILTTHYLEEAESLCKGIAIIDQGKIVENTTVKQLLGKMNKQTIILELAERNSKLPQVEHCMFSQVDDLTIEVVVPQTYSLNKVFKLLETTDIIVASMRHKSNRLEELFIDLIQSNKESANAN